MRDKWVDTDGYLGPDRRRRTGSKPWRDRRRHDETVPLPALGSLLRRLRVHLTDMRTPDQRRRALQMLDAAMAAAQQHQQYECLQSLRRADRLLRTGGAADQPAIEAALLEAMTNAS